MPFYVLVKRGAERKVITNQEFLSNPSYFEQFQIIEDCTQKPDGRPLLLKVPYGTGEENIRVRVKQNATQLTVIMEDGEDLLVTVMSVGLPKQRIRVYGYIARSMISGNVFKSALIDLLSNDHQGIPRRHKHLVVDILINANAGQDPKVSFIDHLGRSVQCFLDYPFKRFHLKRGSEKRFIPFEKLHYHNL